MRVAIIGSNGQLGSDLVKAFSGHDVIAWTRNDFDVRDHPRASDAIATVRPDLVINTAAFHKTDACEDDPELAFAVNAVAVRNLAHACEASGAALVQISTDYVFDGQKGEPYTEDDCPRPINTYGVSKLAGERFVQAICSRHYVIRLASIFGVAGASGKGGNFVETMLAKARRGEVLTVVDDVTMSPTYTLDAAVAICRLVDAGAQSGVYHLTNTGACTWYEFAGEILRQSGITAVLNPTSIAAMSPKAPRPRHSALTSRRLRAYGLPPMRLWREALATYLEARPVGVKM